MFASGEKQGLEKEYDAVAVVASAMGVAHEGEKLGGKRQPRTLVFCMSNVDAKRFRAMPRDEKSAPALEGLRKGLRGRQQVKGIASFLRERVPGFANFVLATITARPGVRETRQIEGERTQCFLKGGLTLALAAAAMMLAAPAMAQHYPTRPIQLIVPFPAGGASDITARSVAEALGKELGQPVVVENRPGAGANVGMQALLAAPADGHTLMMGSNVIATAKFLYPNITWDVKNDIRAVIGVTMSPNIVLVPASSPANTLQEFVELARSRELVYGSSGAGTLPQIATEMFKQHAKLDLLHIPYRGAGQALPALVAAEVDIFFDIIFSAQGQVRAGTVKALAVTSLERIPQFPDIPTLHEEGLENFEAISWFGIIARAEVPDEIASRLNEALNTVLKSERFLELAKRIGSTPIGGTQEDFRAMIDRDIATWGEVIKRAGIVVGQ